MDESIIITFANQKGGVGKTTLCVTFANYLVKKGLPVIVIDCDSQESLAQRRESDLKRYPSGDTNSRADMERFCTLSDLDGQLEVTQAAFDTIFKEIFGHIEADTENG